MATSKKTSQVLEAFVNYLHECGRRVTPERMTILEEISCQPGPFSIDDIKTSMTANKLTVAQATIYNTVELLVEAKMIRKIHASANNTALYVLHGNDPHILLVCDSCGSVKERNIKDLTRFINKYDFQTFVPTGFTLTIHGLCRKCRKRNN